MTCPISVNGSGLTGSLVWLLTVRLFGSFLIDGLMLMVIWVLTAGGKMLGGVVYFLDFSLTFLHNM